MRPEAAKRLNRRLAIDASTGIVLPALLAVLIALWLVFWVTNVPVSRQIKEGHFIRWTVEQADYGQSLPRVFVDLPDGRTTAVVAWANWQPPEIGSTIRVEEETLRWYGKRYSLVP